MRLGSIYSAAYTMIFKGYTLILDELAQMKLKRLSWKSSPPLQCLQVRPGPRRPRQGNAPFIQQYPALCFPSPCPRVVYYLFS